MGVPAANPAENPAENPVTTPACRGRPPPAGVGLCVARTFVLPPLTERQTERTRVRRDSRLLGIGKIALVEKYVNDYLCRWKGNGGGHAAALTLRPPPNTHRMGGKKQTRARRAAAAAAAEDVPAGPARWLAAAERPQLAARAAAEMLSPVSSPPLTSSSAGDGLSEVRATSRKKDRRRGLPPGQPTVAQTVNRYECYEQSVQEPRREISCIISIHRQVTMELSARRDVCASLPPPRVLREDFCGTAILSREWALRNVQNVAYGVDIDPAVVLYARERTLKDAKRGSVEDRVQLYVGDVLTCG
ncbi:MAG: hypothetical protein BJ554DRAFT_4617 [Olpidium bornovanus]|uniref:Uncharacterized protein n=1 Tax=Olpidium bornovanus TaxID=278681 RepID=A0A8H7ZMD0_9FUNG|nr:MAG: hypothetical protein BJ554DRAFT_4617 [Olpidium bornovanus]